MRFFLADRLRIEYPGLVMHGYDVAYALCSILLLGSLATAWALGVQP